MRQDLYYFFVLNGALTIDRIDHFCGFLNLKFINKKHGLFNLNHVQKHI